jgi:hypothetical protein
MAEIEYIRIKSILSTEADKTGGLDFSETIDSDGKRGGRDAHCFGRSHYIDF